MFRNSKEGYGSVAQFFHWLMALLIIGMLFLGFLMVGENITDVHQIIGLCILTLAALRLIWKLVSVRPQLPASVSKLDRIAAHIVQVLLYLCMFGMPLTGWAMSTAFGLIPHIGTLSLPMPGINVDQSLGDLLKTIHNTIAFVLIGLVSLHILGALKHQFIDKDPRVLNSMLPNFLKIK